MNQQPDIIICYSKIIKIFNIISQAYKMRQFEVSQEIHSFSRSLQSSVIRLCPLLQKFLIVFFFGLLFGLSNYIIMLISYAELQYHSKLFLLVFGVWCLLNIIFNYVMSILVKPGNPHDIPMNLLSKIKKRCNKCNSIKPPRTHHCSICNSCIIQMDHHCPWIGNCVGHHNRQYFVNFLTYLTFGLTLGIWLQNFKGNQSIFVLILTLLICVGCFAGYHWIIVLKGRTSLEVCLQDKEYQPLQSYSHNLKIVFGSSNIFVCLMPRITILKNHGHQWIDL